MTPVTDKHHISDHAGGREAGADGCGREEDLQEAGTCENCEGILRGAAGHHGAADVRLRVRGPVHTQQQGERGDALHQHRLGVGSPARHLGRRTHLR